MFGGPRPIQWIGRYPIRRSNPSKPWVKDALPVRVARSALAPDVPHTDLYVTGGHCLLIDGVLVPANMLINGTTITRFEAESDEFVLFHIKLESHDVIYAAGAPAETLFYVDECAVNFASYLRRYGMPITQEVRCAPLIEIGGGRPDRSRDCVALSLLGLISEIRPTWSATGWTRADTCHLRNRRSRRSPLVALAALGIGPTPGTLQASDQKHNGLKDKEACGSWERSPGEKRRRACRRGMLNLGE